MDNNETTYRDLYRIRRFEETVLENFQKGVFHGTTHTYIGQEANAIGVLSQIKKGDVVFSNHRCHGHYLAYGGDMRALFGEMMGKESGVCGGRGGSQHLHWRNFYSNGIQGGIVPIATGMALAEKYLRPGTIAICFLGDGTLGEGVVYESLNLASLWELPILYVLENNKIAQTTSIDQALAGSISGRFTAFGLQTTELDSYDVLEIGEVAGRCIDQVRKDCVPQALILHTERFGPHSKGDDTRDHDTLENLRRERDPLDLFRERISVEDIEVIEKAVDQEVKNAYDLASEDPPATTLKISSFVNPKLKNEDDQNAIADSGKKSEIRQRETVLSSLNRTLHQTLTSDPRCILLGEDILDPYGGAFKVTRGLSSEHPDRVRTTPISEAGIIGMAAGAAMRGMHPVVEIMFGDFLTLAADQIINHIAKFHWMYNEQVNVPVLIRTPMGGRRGYGPTHSQTLEKVFLGIPGLCILAPSDMASPGEVLRTALDEENAVIFIENKLLYSLPVQSEETLDEFQVLKDYTTRGYPIYELKIRGAPRNDLTLVSYGYMAMVAREAALQLAYEHEIFANLIILSQLSPFELAHVIESVSRTGRVMTLEEGTYTLGWWTEIIAQVADALGEKLIDAKRIGAKNLPIPAARTLENAVLPDSTDVLKTAVEMIQRQE